MIQNEMKVNPHFTRAFPHLAQNYNEADYEPHTVGWGESLLFQKQSSGMKPFEVIHETEKTFVEGYRTVPGPVSWLSEEDKERINLEINLKMDELEETGLSRQEILNNIPGGIPLSQDPVFQYLRHNYLAREMVLRPGEEYTAFKVIDCALRQDFGTDRTNVKGVESIYKDMAPEEYEQQVYFGHRYPDLVEPRDYYWKEDLKGKSEKLGKFFARSLPIHPIKVESAYERYKKNKRQISRKDIHYKNTEFLCQFMNESGHIKNRLQTRLGLRDQKRVARAIKHSKQLRLIPSRGFILPVHKMNLVPLHAQNFQDMAIHKETGAVLSKKEAGEGSYHNTVEHPNTIEKIAKRFHLPNHNDDLEANEKRTKELIDYDIQFFPNNLQTEIIEAHNNLANRKNVNKSVEKLINNSLNNTDSTTFHEKFIFESGADESLV
jgi:small subunit ribosomal protein S18